MGSSEGRGQTPKLLTAALVTWVLLACSIGLQCTGSSSLFRKCDCRPTKQQAEAQGDASEPAPAGAAAVSRPGPANRNLTWQQVADAIWQPAGLHGIQEKGGLPATWMFMLTHMTNRNPDLHGLPGITGPAVYRWFAHTYT